MKTISKTIYDAPKVEIVELKVEQGFANSGLKFGNANEAGADPFFYDFGEI